MRMIYIGNQSVTLSQDKEKLACMMHTYPKWRTR